MRVTATLRANDAKCAPSVRPLLLLRIQRGEGEEWQRRRVPAFSCPTAHCRPCRPTVRLDSSSARLAAHTDADGETLTSSGDLKTNACACAAAPPPHVRALLRRIPEPVLSRFYGCGSPLPLGCEGLRLLDLGSGSGRCVVVSRARSLQHAPGRQETANARCWPSMLTPLTPAGTAMWRRR